jgi:hypothetical protein
VNKKKGKNKLSYNSNDIYYLVKTKFSYAVIVCTILRNSFRMAFHEFEYNSMSLTPVTRIP